VLKAYENSRLFSDTSFHGIRVGYRSIRLNRSYRAIYKVVCDSSAEVVRVEEVNKHDH